jgi:hypothetical protein
MKAKEIALEKLWNLLILLTVGEVSTAFHYGNKKLGWLLMGLATFVVLIIAIAFLSSHIDRREE